MFGFATNKELGFLVDAAARREADMLFAFPYSKRTQSKYLGSFPRSLETTQGQFYIVKALDDLVQPNNLHYFTQSDRRVK